MIWYNEGAKGKSKKKRKAGKIMNADMNLNMNNNENKLVSDDCNCSVYSMLTVAGGLLLAIGTVIYSLIVH